MVCQDRRLPLPAHSSSSRAMMSSEVTASRGCKVPVNSNSAPPPSRANSAVPTSRSSSSGAVDAAFRLLWPTSRIGVPPVGPIAVRSARYRIAWMPFVPACWTSSAMNAT